MWWNDISDIKGRVFMLEKKMHDMSTNVGKLVCRNSREDEFLDNIQEILDIFRNMEKSFKQLDKFMMDFREYVVMAKEASNPKPTKNKTKKKTTSS